ncbi:MAG: response regulator transcription factor [Lachnospiraceae bacterium]|nr:response regulator transcription factor [Lachnospiraceae bacterium]
MNLYWKKILIVDDDISILNMLEILLRKENFKEIYKTTKGQEAILLNEKMKFDIVLLDINLPDMDGYEVCRKIRNISMVPIVFLSGKEEETDKLISFAMGGDDYMTKPFKPKELIARVYAILKRMEYYESKNNYKEIYRFEDYSMNFEKKELYKKEKIVDLTLKEYMFLSYLIRNENITVSKEQIIKNVWGDEYDGCDNTIMVHIRHLREKIEENPSNPCFIKTVKGRGYRFERNKCKV